METVNPHPSFTELAPSEASIFLDKISTAKRAQKHGAAVDLKSLGEYKKSRMFLTKDGMAGYAVSPNGELNSVFKHPDSQYQDVARHAAEHATLIGGATHASAFSGYLTEAYARGGMRPVAYQEFADEYKPAGWRFRLHGRPPVAFLAVDRSVAHAALSAQQAGKRLFPAPKPGEPHPLMVDDNDVGYGKAEIEGILNKHQQLPSTNQGPLDASK
jgi:hypothetical protein